MNSIFNIATLMIILSLILLAIIIFGPSRSEMQEKENRYTKECELKAGFVYRARNEGKICLKNSSVIKVDK